VAAPEEWRVALAFGVERADARRSGAAATEEEEEGVFDEMETGMRSVARWWMLWS